MNRVTSPYGAIVDGKQTGLAGCACSASCPRAASCLRADQALAMRAEPYRDGAGRCTVFIRAN